MLFELFTQTEISFKDSQLFEAAAEKPQRLFCRSFSVNASHFSCAAYWWNSSDLGQKGEKRSYLIFWLKGTAEDVYFIEIRLPWSGEKTSWIKNSYMSVNLENFMWLSVPRACINQNILTLINTKTPSLWLFISKSNTVPERNVFLSYKQKSIQMAMSIFIFIII